MIKLHIEKAGLQSLVQDQGRKGYQAFGVPMAGPMDWYAASLLNRLLGLTKDHPVLEFTLMGPRIRVEGDCQICLTGANLSPKLNGEVVEMCELIAVKSGSVLSFSRAQSGCRTYMGVRGTYMGGEWLGSNSSFLFSDVNDFNFNVLKNNSVIEFSKLSRLGERRFKFPAHLPIASPQVVRILAGPEFEEISRRDIADFFSQTFILSNDSNRMGYRLNPPLKDYQASRELISSGTMPGTIQISNSGQPIILMADAQTSGGYFRIGNVIRADMPLLGQMKPGDKMHFSLTTLEEARAAEKQLWEQLKNFDFS
ncbi:MAG: biotin-dependent carboxyltransferase family protein [Bacteroidota bacterium]